MTTSQRPTEPNTLGGNQIPAEATGLERDALGPWGVFAQGLAAAAPSVAIAVVPFSLFVAAGKGAAWAAVIGLVIVALIATTISFQAKRTVTSGSLGTYTGNGLGPGFAYAAGFSLLFGYIGFATTGTLGGVLYLDSSLESIGLGSQSAWFRLLLVVVVVAVAVYLPYRGVSLTAKYELAFEVVALVSAIDALRRHGARQEGQFIRTRKPLTDEDPAALRAATAAGVTVLSWPEVLTRGLGEQVRQVQYDTFLEHFGNMSKTPELWQHHIESRAFTPDFSLAAVDDDDGGVIGYVLGSTYTAGASHGRERSAHTDYIGVRADQRRHGLGELLLKKVWLAAVARGLSAASLGTDIHNRSNAHLLYQRLGYVAVEDQYAYRIDADANR